jgi:hypothetical protein
MNCLEFLELYWSDSLETALEIWYTFTDYDPSVGVGIEFDWEALDENGVDRADDLSAAEENELRKKIKQAIREEPPFDPY